MLGSSQRRSKRSSSLPPDKSLDTILPSSCNRLSPSKQTDSQSLPPNRINLFVEGLLSYYPAALKSYG